MSATPKITRAEAIGLRIPYAERVRENMVANYRRENVDRSYYSPWIVRIHTDAGLVGLGEATTDPREQLAGLSGRTVWSLLHDASRGNGVMMAVYDLAAQAAGVPVCRLFSSQPRRTIQQIWWSHSLRPDLMKAETRRAIEQGYTVHKIKARPYEDTVAQVAAMAEVAPHDYRILVDANGSFGSPGKALAVAEALQRFHQVKAFEQPIAHEDLPGHREIRKHLKLRLAVHWEAVDVRSFMLESLCDSFVVEDFRWGPALTEKSALCELTGQTLWVENGLNTGLSQVFQAHMAAALPNVEFTISLTHVAEDDVVIEPFVMDRGRYTVPQKPGIGVTLDQPAVDKYRV
ncbi:MAG: hypothetical protein FJW34_03760 [Acidobacteria bacterium]|nr:hypothetical protein [Acidobacteriota bacterium]